MNSFARIIFISISISILGFLIFVTYLSNSLSSFEKPYHENIKQWLFELSKNWTNDYTINELSNINTWAILVNNVTINDRVIYSNWEVETKTESWSTIISITEWIYFFDLKWLNDNYIIKSKWFELNNKWPWTFIINNLNYKKTVIFSINSLLDLNLKHYKTNEHITSIDLYPHTYIIFNPLKNIFVKNSDLLKISQTFILKYFNEQILKDWIISVDLFDRKLVQDESTEEIVKKLVEYSLFLIKQEKKERLKVIKDFTESRFAYIPWERYMDEYFYLLINSNKKSYYYKNIITRDLKDLLLLKELDEKIVNKINDNLIILGQTDKHWEEEIRNIINYYYASIIKANKNIEVKLNFFDLINKINNSAPKNNLKSLIYLGEIFIKYDYDNSLTFYKDINNFSSEYFNDLNIGLNESNERLSLEMKKIDYMLFFLENIILSSEFSASDLKELLTIFKNYVHISYSFYTHSDDKIKRKWIYTNSEIIKKLKEIISNIYFEKQRDINWLLKINKNITVDTKDIISIEENINKVLKYYNDSYSVLKASNKMDAQVIKLYSTLTENYKEYFIALNNYKEYSFLYDKSKTILLDTDTVNENDKNISLSINQAVEYLKTFNSLQLNNTEITIMDYYYCINPSENNEKIELKIPYCYKIKNLLIDWNNVSFLLHPFERNKINEIIVNDVIKSWSYKLDDIKASQDTLVNSSSSIKEKYDFKDFLKQKFWYKEIDTKQVIIIEEKKEIKLEEETIIKVFKRNKLFWKDWDFANLWSFLNINYNDVIVNKIDNNYIINVKLWIFDIKLTNSSDFYWYFSSNYNFSPKHSFINPKLKFVDKKSEKDLLFWNYIYINWEYKVNELNEEIKEPLHKYKEISSIISSCKSILGIEKMKITYQKNTKIITFNIQYNWKILLIELSNSNITKLVYNNSNRLWAATNYKNISTFLNRIK